MSEDIYDKTIPLTIGYITIASGLWWINWFSTVETGAFVAGIGLMHATVGVVEGYL